MNELSMALSVTSEQISTAKKADSAQFILKIVKN